MKRMKVVRASHGERSLYHLPFQFAEVDPILGASGAIYAMAVLTALYLPSSSVSVLLLPFAVPIGAAVSGILFLDVVGLIRGWK